MEQNFCTLVEKALPKLREVEEQIAIQKAKANDICAATEKRAYHQRLRSVERALRDTPLAEIGGVRSKKKCQLQ